MRRTPPGTGEPPGGKLLAPVLRGFREVERLPDGMSHYVDIDLEKVALRISRLDPAVVTATTISGHSAGTACGYGVESVEQTEGGYGRNTIYELHEYARSAVDALRCAVQIIDSYNTDGRPDLVDVGHLLSDLNRLTERICGGIPVSTFEGMHRPLLEISVLMRNAGKWEYQESEFHRRLREGY